MALPVKNHTTVGLQIYGDGPYFWLNGVILTGGGTNNITIPPVNGTVPPCQLEILSGTRTGTGRWTLQFADNYYAIADWDVAIDDVNGATPLNGYLGQFANLGAKDNTGGGPSLTGTSGLPMTCVLTVYANNVANDPAANTPVRISILFKKETTGPVA